MENEVYINTFVDYIMCKDPQKEEAILQKLYKLELQELEKWDKEKKAEAQENKDSSRGSNDC